jgi:tetratricopeptide (TPR) repeat protein
MNLDQIFVASNAVNQHLLDKQLKRAIEMASLIVTESQLLIYADKLEELNQHYNLLLQYYILGTEDPNRVEVYNSIASKLFVLNAELKEEVFTQNSSYYQYTTKRFFNHTKRYKISTELFNALLYFHNQSSLLKSSADNHQIELRRIRANFELILPELFGVFFLSSKLNDSEQKLHNEILSSDYPGKVEKLLIISALTLNLCRMFDEKKLNLLLDAVVSHDTEVKQRALVGLVFVLAKYNDFLPFFATLKNRLTLICDDQTIVRNLQQIIIQIIATAETENLSKRMKEEILPEMMKISPFLSDKLKSDSNMAHDEGEDENMAWEEMLEKSGLKNTLKELTDLQQEGADVYMSTFAMLKNFPFFREFSNWFMPFDSNHSAISQLVKSGNSSLISAFVNNKQMCNSDKYSFCFTILQMPETASTNLLNNFTSEAEQLDEINKEEALLTPDVVEKNISKQYIQDLYRFFNLFPHKSDFDNVFDYSLSLHHSHLFELMAIKKDLISSVADYYFIKGHFAASIELMLRVHKSSKLDAALMQKLGYAYQQIGDMKLALEAYQRAEMIAPDDFWTVKKMGYCSKQMGNYQQALENYQHANYLKPNQKGVLFQMASCLAQLGRYEEALKIYFQLEAEFGEEVKAWRPIIRCALLAGNMAKADYYLGKVLTSEPNATDYMHAAHVAWSQKRMKHAVDFYRQSKALNGGKMDVFLQQFNADAEILSLIGIMDSEIPLMLDALSD